MSEDLEKFYNFLWGSHEGFVYLPTLDRNTGQWRKIFFRWPEHKSSIISHTLATSAKGLECFVSPVLFKEANPEKKSVLGSRVLWTEFDGNTPAELRTLPEAGTLASPSLPGGIPAPCAMVQSSTDDHVHLYWSLDQFTTDSVWIEDRNRSIAYTLRSDVSGWDINQVLRPPDTTNYKHNLPVTLAYINNQATYKLDSFKELKAPARLVDENIDVSDLPKVEAVVAKYPWDEDHYKLVSGMVDQGNRSTALMRLGYYCAEQGMEDTEIYTIISYAASRWGKFTGRNDRHRRLVDIVNKAKLKHPVGLKDVVYSGLLSSSNKPSIGQLVYGFQDFVNSEFDIEWAIEGLLEKTGFAMLSSKPGVGKTQILMQWGFHNALGREFLGFKPTKKMKIVFLSLEMSHVALKIFATEMAKGFSAEDKETLQENFLIIPIGEPIGFDKPEGLVFIDSLLSDINPDGVIIDSVSKLSRGDISSEVTAKALNESYAHIRNKHQCWIWLIHHNRKASGENKKPVELEDIFGNVLITAEMTVVMTLWKESSGKITINTPKARLSPNIPSFKIQRNDHLSFSIAVPEEEKAVLENTSLKNVATKHPFGLE